MMIMSHTITTGDHPPDTFAATPRWAEFATKNELLRMFTAWLAERALRRAEDELQRLDDRTLKDIGLTRGQISSALRELARGRVDDIAGLVARRQY
jgi:uncharacterized protein YjiS (DUF1127 family)